MWNHKLSAAFVREHYAAVLDPHTGRADLAATQELRQQLRQSLQPSLDAA